MDAAGVVLVLIGPGSVDQVHNRYCITSLLSKCMLHSALAVYFVFVLYMHNYLLKFKVILYSKQA